MKLMVREKFFNDLLSGRKKFDLRDAHITFTAEETGRVAHADVIGVILYSRGMSEGYLKKTCGVGGKLFDELFEDEWQIAFSLGDVRLVDDWKKVKG